MNSLWLKIKVWTKLIVFVLVLVYLLLFFIQNSGKYVTLWYFFGREYPNIPLLLLLFVTFAIGVIGTLLVGTLRNTIKQIRELRARSRAQKLEQEMADLKAKAAKLQTRPEGPPSQGPSQPTV